MGVLARPDGMTIVIGGDLDGEAKDSSGDEGCVGFRQGGCCRIRRRPETPRPCSCSGITGDRTSPPFSVPDPASKENRIFRLSESALAASDRRFPVLRFFGSETALPGIGVLRRPDTERECPASPKALCVSNRSIGPSRVPVCHPCQSLATRRRVTLVGHGLEDVSFCLRSKDGGLTIILYLCHRHT